MSKATLIWNSILTVGIIALAAAFFTNKKNGNYTSKKPKKDSIQQENSFSMAYFEMDSIETHYQMVKDVKAEISSREKQYNQSLAGLETEYRNKILEYQKKESTMTQADYENVQMELKRLENSLGGRKNKLDQDYADFVTKKNLSVKKMIEEYLQEFNHDNRYTYIISYEPGLFYFRDTVYNITSEILQGLNEDYKKNKK